MKCPKCGYTSFNNLAACQKCNHPYASGEKPAAAPSSPGREKGYADVPSEVKPSELARPPNLAATLESIKISLAEIDGKPPVPSRDGTEVDATGSIDLVEGTPVVRVDDSGMEFAANGGAEPIGRAKGGFLIRALAFGLDGLILDVLSVLVLLVGATGMRLGSGGGPGISVSSAMMTIMEEPLYAVFFSCVSIAVAGTYFTYFHGSQGQTPGKMICRLKVVRADGRPPGYGRALVRWLGYILSGLPFYAGFLWVLFDRNKQAWHDKLAGTYVVRKVRT
jgi:uncharacterized RDD family membrane protein YckC